MGVTSLFLNASGGIPDDASDEALEMDTESEELEFSIRPIEIAQDEASMSTIVGDISLLDKSMLY